MEELEEICCIQCGERTLEGEVWLKIPDIDIVPICKPCWKILEAFHIVEGMSIQKYLARLIASRN